MAQRTSKDGLKALKHEEGEVLRAYRCPAGIWTIGVGLTAASGVVRPVAGMTISPEESDRLLALALERNYEPAVRRAMNRTVGPMDHEFDAGVGFHFNTGAIARASWVKRWLVGDWAGTETAFKAWNKGGGKVLPGLVARREREFRMLRAGVYEFPGVRRPSQPIDGLARLAAPITAAQVPALVEALVTLGYAPALEVKLTSGAVKKFQDAHGLTVDGIVGRATASAIQRALDARAKGSRAFAATGAGAAAGGVAVNVEVPDFGIPGLEAFPALAAAVWGARIAFQYRDTIAAALHVTAPRLARWLRSF